MAETVLDDLTAPGPAATVPGLKDVAANIVGSAKTPAQVVAEAPKPPSSDEVRAARLARDDAQDKARRGQLERAAAEKAQINAVTLDSQAFAEKSRAVAERARQGPQTPPQPSRGLRPFLASSENDPPENTIAKLMQSISLMATMVGGGKSGARASLSALTGALEGWQVGDRARADRAYADWKAKTDTLLESWEREMRGYQIALRSEGIPIEQRMRILDLEARNNQNVTLAENAGVADAQKFLDELEKRQAAVVDLQMWASKMDAQKAEADRRHEDFEKKLNTQTEISNKLMDVKLQGILAGVGVAQAKIDERVRAAEAKADKAAAGKTPPDRQQKITEDFVQTETHIAKLMELANHPRVDLNKIVGGIRPWVNQMIQRWGRPDSAPPPEGTTSGQISVAGKLSEEEMQFLSLLQNYGDTILRQRSGAAISQYELKNLLTFVPDQSLSAATLRARLTLTRQENLAKWTNHANTQDFYGYKTIRPGTLPPVRIEGQDDANPYNLKKDGNEWVSPDGKHVWRNGVWQAK